MPTLAAAPQPPGGFPLKSPTASAASSLGQIIYPADGAIAITPHIAVLTKGSAGAYTLAAPAATQDGDVLEITSGSAFAHVVTSPSGTVQDGTTGAKTTITLAAFKGASVKLRAVASLWHLIGKSVATIA